MQDSLAARLEHGPLDPVQALKYASEIAAALREMHRHRCGHGAIHAESILLANSGLLFSAPQDVSGEIPLTRDIADFGTLLFRMLTARQPEAGTGRRKVPGGTGLQAACLQLAGRCMAATAAAGPDMQKVCMEIRLLLLLARQPRAEPLPIALPQPAEPARAVPQIVRPIAPKEQMPPALELPDQASLPMPTGSRCPKCQGHHVHRAESRTLVEGMLETLGFPSRLCQRCSHRFVDIYGVRARISRQASGIPDDNPNSAG